MTKMPWFRVYSEIIDDRKIKRISKKTGQSKALIIGIWTCLLALANDAPERGTLNISVDIPYDMDDLEDELGLPSELIEEAIDEFKSLGMLNGHNTLEIVNWNKRQFKSDYSTERVKRHRAKKNDETLQKRSGNVIDTETESDTESDTEKESETTTSSSRDFGQLTTAYEHNMGVLTPMIGEMLEEDLQTYGLQICLDAILVAVGQNKRKWSYVRGIMKNWWADGRGPGKEKEHEPQQKKVVLPSGEITEVTV